MPSSVTCHSSADVLAPVTKDAARVWLVDDSAAEARAQAQALAGEHEVTVFTDGAAALERLQGTAHPDVLVLDWMMPGMSGIEVCRFVRRTQDELALPILIVTGNSTEEELLQALAAGANDFIAKPVKPLELQARVRTLAGLRRLREQALDNERQRAEEATREVRASLQAANQERDRLAEANRRRDQYLGILGHDLRNPLSAIITASNLLVHAGTEWPPERAAVRIRHSAERMTLMIRDLLDFARGQLGGGIPIEPVDADLGDICRDVVDELHVAHPGREIQLQLAGDLSGQWDPNRLSQAISNLVGNAIEHGAGAIRVEARGDGPAVAVVVHNDGEPIPPEEHPSLFEAFRRRGQSGGLGLGLYIVKRVVEAHGGRVALSSTTAAGTSFSVWLPRLRAGVR
jgi:sigma-B regulation protein RsbU (phosphoserine phosphatase)